MPVDLSLSQDAVHFRGGFGVHRGRPGWEMDWDGFKILALATEAARRGINELSKDMADTARTEHPWQNETFQTEEAVFHQDAELEVHGWTPASTPHVWGAWGVEDRPRYKHISVSGPSERDPATGRFRAKPRDAAGRFVAKGAIIPTDEEEDASTVDVALFLEFGTIHMEPFPWLYPAWDSNKLRLPEVIAKHYRELSALNWQTYRFGTQFAALRGMFGPTFWKV